MKRKERRGRRVYREWERGGKDWERLETKIRSREGEGEGAKWRETENGGGKRGGWKMLLLLSTEGERERLMK